VEDIIPNIILGDGMPAAMEARFWAYLDGEYNRFKKDFSHTMLVLVLLVVLV
jgi:hypothetical protein